VAKTKIQVRELQIWADRFLSSPEYRLNLKERILAGEAQAIELALYHYAYGKPKEELKVSGGGDGVFILNIGGVEIVRRELQDGEIIDTTGGVLPEKTEELADAHD